MKRHTYVYWGLGHMSHPEDPTSCCGLSERAPIHLCYEKVGEDRLPRDWRYCSLTFGHEGAHRDGAS